MWGLNSTWRSKRTGISCAMACRSVSPCFMRICNCTPAVKVVTAVWMSFESSPFTVMFVPET